VNKNNPLASYSSISFSMLKNEHFLALNKTSYYQQILSRVVESYNYLFTPYFETDDLRLLFNMIDKGSGILITIRKLHEETLALLPNVILVPLEERDCDLCTAFAYMNYASLDPSAKQFIQFIIDRIKQDQMQSPEANV
jgi:DNA-binding transcriptional LysR family regulator